MPPARKMTDVDWICWWRESRESNAVSLVEAHKALHAQYGSGGASQSILNIEKGLSTKLRARGIEHRFDDDLARRARTVVKNAVAPSPQEIAAYSPPELVIDPRAVEILQDVDGGELFVRFSGALGLERAVLKAVQSRMPPGVEIKMLSGPASEGLASSTALYRLALVKAAGEKVITTWSCATEELRESAAAASNVFKQGLSVPFNLVKQAEARAEERIVTGVHLEPGVIDTTRQNADGTPTGAVGDSYTEEEICKAMHWWMENASHRFAYYHTVKGGLFLSDSDVRLLENWQTRQAEKLGEQDVPKGAWVSTVRIVSDSLWNDIKSGRIRSWSIGALAMASYEDVAVPA